MLHYCYAVTFICNKLKRPQSDPWFICNTPPQALKSQLGFLAKNLDPPAGSGGGYASPKLQPPGALNKSSFTHSRPTATSTAVPQYLRYPRRQYRAGIKIKNPQSIPTPFEKNL